MDIGVPHYSVEFHLGRPERVVVGKNNVDHEGTAFIWSVRWAFDMAFEVKFFARNRLDRNVRAAGVEQVLDFFIDTPFALHV